MVGTVLCESESPVETGVVIPNSYAAEEKRSCVDCHLHFGARNDCQLAGRHLPSITMMIRNNSPDHAPLPREVPTASPST
jgi:hypothetical protein